MTTTELFTANLTTLVNSDTIKPQEERYTEYLELINSTLKLWTPKPVAPPKPVEPVVTKPEVATDNTAPKSNVPVTTVAEHYQDTPITK